MSFGADLVGLPHDFRGRAIFADIGRVDAGPEMAVTDVLGGPPCQKSTEALFGLPFRPVELGGEVVGHALADPLARVGVKHFVLVEALDAFGKSRPPNTKGADAELDPRLLPMHRGVHGTHQGVDVLPAPIGSAEFSSGPLIGAPTAVIGEGGLGP